MLTPVIVNVNVGRPETVVIDATRRPLNRSTRSGVRKSADRNVSVPDLG